MTIFITQKQKDTIDAYLKFQNVRYRLPKMAEELGITSIAVNVRIRQLIKKGLFTRVKHNLTYHNLPIKVVGNMTATATKRAIKFEEKLTEKNLKPVTIKTSSTPKPPKKSTAITVCQNNSQIRIDTPCELPNNKYQGGKLTRIGIPKYRLNEMFN
jgi:biotin operon repressor